MSGGRNDRNLCARLPFSITIAWTKVIIVFGFHFRYLLTAKYRERVQFRNVCNSPVMSNNKVGKENDVHFFFNSLIF